MPEQSPLYFTKRLGGLYPNSPAAEKALAAVDGRVRVRITSSRGNDRRMALYWIVLGIAAPILSDMCEGDPLDDAMLHRVLKDRKGLYTETVLPSGEVVRNYDSISFAKMPENERAAYIDWAFATLSTWLKIPIEVLTSEARDVA